jgi:hypothetical protein
VWRRRPEHAQSLLFDFVTRAEYRGVVKQEFDGIESLFGAYLAALGPAYDVPSVPKPE